MGIFELDKKLHNPLICFILMHCTYLFSFCYWSTSKISIWIKFILSWTFCQKQNLGIYSKVPFIHTLSEINFWVEKCGLYSVAFVRPVRKIEIYMAWVLFLRKNTELVRSWEDSSCKQQKKAACNLLSIFVELTTPVGWQGVIKLNILKCI